MDGRNSSKKSDVLIEKEKEPVAVEKKRLYNYGVRNLQSLIEARIIYFGSVTGQKYEWPKAGSIVPVDERDVPELLAKRVGSRGCCGAQDGNKVFGII